MLDKRCEPQMWQHQWDANNQRPSWADLTDDYKHNEYENCVSVKYEDVCMNVAGSMKPCHNGYENKKV